MSVVKEKREIIVIVATASIGFLFYYFTGFPPVFCVVLFGFIMGTGLQPTNCSYAWVNAKWNAVRRL